MKVVVLGNDVDVEVDEIEEIHEVNGKNSPAVEDKILKSVMQNDKRAIDDGKLISESFNQGLSVLFLSFLNRNEIILEIVKAPNTAPSRKVKK